MKNYLRIGCFVLLLFALSVSAVAQENQAMINSSDLLQQIESGEDVFIDGKTIKGKLNLSEGNFSLNEDGLYIITSKIVIENSDFKDEMDFSNALFEKDVQFRYCNFGNVVNFKHSVFRQMADFCATTFITDVDFSQVVFEKRALFSSTIFYMVYFNNSKFNGFTQFSNTDLIRFVFDNVTFKSESRFERTKLGNMPKFKNNTNFEGNVYFNYIESNSQILFSNVTFHKEVMFRGNNLAPDIRFSYVNFKGMADFQLAKYGIVSFSNVNFKGMADFDLARFNILSFSNTTFSLISLTDTDYNETYIEWEDIKGKLVFDGDAYLKLRNNFINQGKYREADDVYYQYRVNMREKKGFLDCILDWLMEVTCGYGLKPENTLFTGAVLIIGFSIYYFNIMQNIIIYKKRNTLKKCIDAFFISLGAFFTYSGYENEYLRYRHHYVIIIERILGWFVLTLFIVTLTNVMVRP